MKEILLYKQIDFWAQIMAFAIPLVVGVVTNEMDAFAMTYFTLAAVQLASLTLNRIYLPKLIRTNTRIILERTTFIILLAILISLIVYISAIIIIAIAMLFVGIIMAVWYFIDTCTELQLIKEVLRRKASDELKEQETNL